MSQMRKCNKCGEEYPATPEYFYRHKACKDALQPVCKKCCCKADKKYHQTEQGKIVSRRAAKKYYSTIKGKQTKKKNQLERDYGLTIEQHEQMYIDQNGCCAICKQSISYDKIFTDHNHKTDKVRGLLCPRCNIGMGYMDDEEFLNTAIKYLNENDS